MKPRQVLALLHLLKEKGGPGSGKHSLLVLTFWDTGMAVNMAPTQPALGSLGVREGCCPSFPHSA